MSMFLLCVFAFGQDTQTFQYILFVFKIYFLVYL